MIIHNKDVIVQIPTMRVGNCGHHPLMYLTSGFKSARRRHSKGHFLQKIVPAVNFRTL